MDRDHEDAEAYQDPTREVPLVCADGDRSSLVAAMLHDLGSASDGRHRG